jgi:hypothetical protein
MNGKILIVFSTRLQHGCHNRCTKEAPREESAAPEGARARRCVVFAADSQQFALSAAVGAAPPQVSHARIRSRALSVCPVISHIGSPA